MTVDIAKIKPGDTLVLELEVSCVNIKSYLPIVVKIDNHDFVSISAGCIIEHKSKPVEFKVGDIVYANYFAKDSKYEIIALYKGVAWCKFINGFILVNFSICYLEHANED